MADRGGIICVYVRRSCGIAAANMGELQQPSEAARYSYEFCDSPKIQRLSCK